MAVQVRRRLAASHARNLCCRRDGAALAESHERAVESLPRGVREREGAARSQRGSLSRGRRPRSGSAARDVARRESAPKARRRRRRRTPRAAWRSARRWRADCRPPGRGSRVAVLRHWKARRGQRVRGHSPIQDRDAIGRPPAAASDRRRTLEESPGQRRVHDIAFGGPRKRVVVVLGSSHRRGTLTSVLQAS